MIKTKKFKLTKALKNHAIKHFGLKETDKDEVYQKRLAFLVLQKKILPNMLAKLQADDHPDNQDKTTDTKKTTTAPSPPTQTDKTPSKRVDPNGSKKGNGGMKKKDIQKAIDDAVTTAVADAVKRVKVELDSGNPDPSILNPAKMFSGAAKVRVKAAREQYDHTHKGATIPERNSLGGTRSDKDQPATYFGKQLNHPSDLDKAYAQAWVKWCINHQNSTGQRVKRNYILTDHDVDLVNDLMHNHTWSGEIGKSEEIYRQKLTDLQRKTLLDDTYSGGIEATPVVFDEAIVLIPVLYGQLFPHVNVENLSRGRRVKSAILNNPTFQSGVAEGTAIQPFNTASFIQAFDTPINVAAGAMEIGLDFEEDTPVDLGAMIIQKYGEKMMEWLDRVIAVGNGNQEPLGFFNSLGLTVISSDNQNGGPPTVGDFENLYFGIAMQWRMEPGAMVAYVSNDVTYARARKIRVAPGDERRVFGMTHGDYELLERPYRIQNNIPNNLAASVNLKRYRMYRRLGLTVRIETQGRQLAIQNTKLIVVRARYGGQIENAGALAVIQNMMA
jgi:HK97 family phage major capsid protein